MEGHWKSRLNHRGQIDFAAPRVELLHGERRSAASQMLFPQAALRA